MQENETVELDAYEGDENENIKITVDESHDSGISEQYNSQTDSSSNQSVKAKDKTGSYKKLTKQEPHCLSFQTSV